jgi:ABC-type multidrug transport system fused ATPase/permease subunit
MYRRLLWFLRPHWWRMAGNILSNVITAGLDVFSFTLLIPFLNELFGKPSPIPAQLGFIGNLQHRIVGQFLEGRGPLEALGTIIVAIGAVVVIKNVFVWLAGQLGASLQEYVTRDLRDAVFITKFIIF